MEEQQEVGEPHGGTEVIEDMAEAVAKLLAQWKTGHFPSIDVNQVMLSDNMTPLSTWAVLYESMNHKGKILFQLDNIKKYHYDHFSEFGISQSQRLKDLSQNTKSINTYHLYHINRPLPVPGDWSEKIKIWFLDYKKW